MKKFISIFFMFLLILPLITAGATLELDTFNTETKQESEDNSTTQDNPTDITSDIIKETAVNVIVSGKTLLNGEPLAGAQVWATRKLADGTHATISTVSGITGNYNLEIPVFTEWKLVAAAHTEGNIQKSFPVSVRIYDTNISRDLHIEVSISVSEPTESTHSATQELHVEVFDGPKLHASAQAIRETGSFRIKIEPDAFTAPEGNLHVLGTTHRFEIADANTGEIIKTFREPIRITLPYRLQDIEQIGAIEDNLIVGFWDEVAEEWRVLEDSVVDKIQKTVSATTDHFTRFAVLTLAPQVDTSHILDGDLIRAENTLDVYIAKRIGNKKFKRLILNPDIFNSYGHLSWENIKTVTQAELDDFVTSGLTIEVYPDGAPVNGKVFLTAPSPDSLVMGMAHWINMTPEQFQASGYDWDAIYKINHLEASPDKFYIGGSVITFN